ncbi:MAG TPA: hypothetical protein PKK15_18100, partial [Kouleothrix sp.]|nr:hypothetical protein [Kouleothrix sp.]
MIDDAALAEFAASHAASLAAARRLIEALHAAAGTDALYVFWNARGSAANPAGQRRTRTLLAFPSPDTALAFAQRNRLPAPRLRRLSLIQLAQAVLREPAIGALLLADDAE